MVSLRTMISPDDFQYAIENTVVIRAPDRVIQTFGTTRFRFLLVSELMDRANEVRVREGWIEADRPQIITPDRMASLLLEGFGEEAAAFARALSHNPSLAAMLKYGFQLAKRDVTESVAHDSMEAVLGRIQAQENAGDALAVIQGVDDAWEVCLLKFSVDLIRQSVGGNLGDFRRRGLL